VARHARSIEVERHGKEVHEAVRARDHPSLTRPIIDHETNRFAVPKTLPIEYFDTSHAVNTLCCAPSIPGLPRCFRTSILYHEKK